MMLLLLAVIVVVLPLRANLALPATTFCPSGPARDGAESAVSAPAAKRKRPSPTPTTEPVKNGLPLDITASCLPAKLARFPIPSTKTTPAHGAGCRPNPPRDQTRRLS